MIKTPKRWVLDSWQSFRRDCRDLTVLGQVIVMPLGIVVMILIIVVRLVAATAFTLAAMLIVTAARAILRFKLVEIYKGLCAWFLEIAFEVDPPPYRGGVM